MHSVSWGRLKLDEELMRRMEGEFKPVGSVERRKNTEERFQEYLCRGEGAGPGQTVAKKRRLL